MRIIGWATALLAIGAPSAATAQATGPLKVERVVLLMRHGVRPPTKEPPMPAGSATQPWPTWPVAPGWLTPHGAAAVRLVARYDRARFAAAGLLPTQGCPTPGQLRLIADSDQRTIATAEAYRETVAPGCTIAITHRPQGEGDPLFDPPSGVSGSTPAAARSIVDAAAGPGGLDGAARRAAPALATIDRILCAPVASECGIAQKPTALSVNDAGKPKLTGALDRGSTAAQIMLLEYAEGKPAADVGWGRADAAAVEQVSSLHALEFALLARPRPFAARNLRALAPLIRDALTVDTGPTVTMIVGHDTNVASLAGLLGVHWTVPGAAPDDPVPGGALLLERVVDPHGQRFLRVAYRAQTIEQIRSLTPLDRRAPPVDKTLPINACPDAPGAVLCPVKDIAALLAAD